jgi:cystathionine gamma-synthase
MTAPCSSETAVVRAGVGSGSPHGDVMPPLHLSSTFTFEGLGRPRKFDYTRSGNPTRETLATTLARLEHGHAGVVTSSGMSAVHVALQACPPNGSIVAPNDCYGGTHRLLTALEGSGRFRVDWVDFHDEDALGRAFDSGPDLLWVETPSNPLLRVVAIRPLAERAETTGTVVVVDNTFLSPALQQPLRLGADIVVHSTTKYINGHSDVVGGAVIARTPDLYEKLAWWANAMGVTGSPFDAYQTLRGLRTLHVRMARHEENAAEVVRTLVANRSVLKVYHPSLPNHPGHAAAQDQQSGYGACVSFELRSEEAVSRFVEKLEYFSLAESLGGVESLVCHPATMTHLAMPPEVRAAANISERLIRLSVGIESSDDLVGDLTRALSHR